MLKNPLSSVFVTLMTGSNSNEYSMKRTILLYGLTLAILVFLLKYLEYRLIVRDLSLEFYMGLVAVFFTALGIWAGRKLTGNTALFVPERTLQRDEIKRLGISKRELQVLKLMAKGLSNQEIADELFVSLNTIKTHSSNLFAKLEVGRRTQAVQRAKELQMIP